MSAKIQSRPDLLLLLSLLLAILLTPAFNRVNWSRLILAAVTFIPIVLSIVRLSQIKKWVWPSFLLAAGNVVFVVVGNTFPSPPLTGIRELSFHVAIAVAKQAISDGLASPRSDDELARAVRAKMW